MKKNKIRFATIITRLVRGGAQFIALVEHSKLPDDLLEKYFICGPELGSEGDYFDLARQKKIEPVIIPQLVRNISPINDIIAFFKLFFFLKKNKIQIVYTMTSKSGILGRFAAYFAGVKFIIHCPTGHIFSEETFFEGVGRSRIKKFIFLALEKIAARVTDKIIGMSEKEIREELEFGIGKPEQYELIRSFVNLDEFVSSCRPVDEVRKELNISDDKLILGIVGRLSSEKGHDNLFKAVQKLKEKYNNIVLLVIGDGPLKDELANLVESLEMKDTIMMLGLKSNVASYVNIFDIFVLSSSSEGFPLVTMEAMALAKPVVATDVGGVPEIIVDNKTGILAQPNSVESLVKGIEKLIVDEPLRKQIGNYGKKVVFDEFSDKIMMEKFLNIIDSFIKRI